MTTSNLWNIQTHKGYFNPQPGDVVVNIDPNDIRVAMDGGGGKWKIAFFQRSGSNYEPFYKDEIAGNIAEGSYRDHATLNEKGMQFVLDNLPRFGRHIASSGTTKVSSYTTGATRHAMETYPEVCVSFIAAAEHALGWTLNSATGEDESALLLMGAKAAHPDIKALVQGEGGSTSEAGIIHPNRGFTHPHETWLGSHTAYAEHEAKGTPYKDIVRRELTPFKDLYRKAADEQLPLIATGSIYRRGVRILMRQTGMHIPLFVPFLPDVRLERSDVMPLISRYADMTGKQIEKAIRPPLNDAEKHVWEKKIASYRDRLPGTFRSLYEIMEQSQAPAIISSAASTRGGVLYADRHGLDISHIRSEPVLLGRRASPSRSERGLPSSTQEPSDQRARVASL
ncbi:MAG TPA: hypothetical protein VFR09_06560 [Alphaproteobacteria bacterium]|nr:hypothetical protein [Alphaproteobacteria bacterium]